MSASIGVEGRVVARRLAIDGAADDQPMQCLERLAVVAQLDGQPVEQLGMRRQGAVAAEVVGRVDDPAAEVIVPDAIDDRPPGEHVLRAGEPVGQGGPAASLVVGIGQVEHGPAGPARSRASPARPASPGCSTSPAPQARRSAEAACDWTAIDHRTPLRPSAVSPTGQGLIRPVAAIDAGEDGLEAVVVGLGDRVELVVVAAGAVDGQADEGRHRARDHVVAVEQPRLELVDGPLAQLDVADEVPGPGGDEPGGDHASRVARARARRRRPAPGRTGRRACRR